MKTILIIKLLITLSIIDYLKSSPNIEYSKLNIELVKHPGAGEPPLAPRRRRAPPGLIQNKLEMLFPTFKISDLLYLVELILSETAEGNLNFKYNNKLLVQSSLDYVNNISLEITIEEDKLAPGAGTDPDGEPPG
jgi:hypothetical protein